MKTPSRIAVVAALVVIVGAVLTAKQTRQNKSGAACCPVVATLSTLTNLAAVAPAVPAPAQKLPRLVDVGAGKCIPCKMMAPILAELKRDYADHFTTDFVDVWENPDAGTPYSIQIIPTQIFFDADGKELFRHEGFFGKEDILAKWKELGVNLEKKE